MLEFVLTVSLLYEQCCDTYVGTFQNCEQAQAYYELTLQDLYKGMSCLHRDYVQLPNDHVDHYMFVTPMSVTQ